MSSRNQHPTLLELERLRMTEVTQDEDGIHVKLESMRQLYEEIDAIPKPNHDPVNHPSHYTHYQGLEVIDLTEQMNFNKGNAVKYIARAGLKNPDTEVEDLEKAVWYLKREIDRIQNRP